MAPSTSDHDLGDEPQNDAPGVDRDQGPDPVIGAGVTLLGIFLMGTGGARDAHWVFDFGVLTAVLGAAGFVLSVALSAMKQRKSRLGPTPPPENPPAAA